MDAQEGDAGSSADGPGLSYEVTGVRQVRATALGRGTHGVPDVRRMVESQFHVAFPHRVWVAGEVGAPSAEGEGVRFVLHAATSEDPFALPCLVPGPSASAVRDLLSRTHDADLEDVVRAGRLARVGGLLRWDAARNAVELTVSELDPTPTGMELEEARRAALRAVADTALADRQRTRVCRTAPLEVGVVGGTGGGALALAEDLLVQSGFAVRVALRPVELTSPAAPDLLARAVREAARDNDVVLLVRDEGRPLGLASFDALQVAQAVADAPVPVVTGLGGAGTRTACDEVAFATLPTAAAAVQWVLTRLGAAEHALEALADAVDGAADTAGARCGQALQESRQQVAEAAEQAAVRSEQVRAGRRLRLRVACALLAVLVLVVALLVGRPLVLGALLLPAALLLGSEQWWKRAPTRGRSSMSRRDDEFTQVLERLGEVREELTRTSSPERVGVLREVAAELLAQGETLLGRHLQPDGPAASGRAASEQADSEQAVPGRAVSEDGSGVEPGAAQTTPAPPA